MFAWLNGLRLILFSHTFRPKPNIAHEAEQFGVQLEAERKLREEKRCRDQDAHGHMCRGNHP